MIIPLVDLQAQYASIKFEIDSAIQHVLESAQFINGPDVSRFEAQFGKFCNDSYAIGVGNGTDGLFLALKALGVGQGDEVITTANTFIATVEAIVSVGAKPVFVDVDPEHFNMTAEGLRAALTSRTKAADPGPHLRTTGTHEGDYVRGEEYSIKIIEDAAQAHGAEYDGRRVGTWGDIATFSFYPAKNLGAFGDAGAVVTSNERIANTVRMMKDHGKNREIPTRHCRRQQPDWTPCRRPFCASNSGA